MFQAILSKLEISGIFKRTFYNRTFECLTNNCTTEVQAPTFIPHKYTTQVFTYVVAKRTKKLYSMETPKKYKTFEYQ